MVGGVSLQGALYTLRFRTYDAGGVSQETVSGFVHGTTTSAPWLVRDGTGRRPKPRRRDVPVVTMLASGLEAAAGTSVLATDGLQDVWGQPPQRASQLHENSGRGQSRRRWSAG
jgi:hypothetical protein